MASSGTVRPAVSRVLQRCHFSPVGNGAAASLPLPPSSRFSARSRPVSWRWSQQQPQLQHHQQRGLSTSVPLEARKTRDSNKLRGVSTIHRSGPREPLSVTGEPIPEPSRDENAGRMTVADNDPDHGLWGFFYDKKVMPEPSEANGHGRPWSAQELRGKSWEDLHALWWVCCRERNRISTANYARDKHKLGFGGQELSDRDAVVKRTMKSIKHVLTERYYAWEDAIKLADEDPEIDLSGNGPIYTPSTYLEQGEMALVEEDPTEVAGSEAAPDAKSQRPEEAVDPSAIPSSAGKPAEETARP